MSNQRVVLTVLILFAIVATICLGSGLVGVSNNGAPDSNWLIQGLKSTFTPPSLKPTEVKSDCLKDGLFLLQPSVEKCDAVVAPSTAYFGSVRIATICNLDDTTLKLNYSPSTSPPSADQKIEMSLGPGEQRSWPILKPGGTLTIARTTGGQAARARLMTDTLPAPKLVEPDPRKPLTSNPESIPQQVTLRWNPVDRAIRYRFAYSGSSNSSSATSWSATGSGETAATSTQIALEHRHGTWKWSITAVGQKDVQSPKISSTFKN
ncbi:MAG: hypothetical protein JWP89_1813 [Schlesneria sp.]|nr:hypothetical protein [Schlesneria sp.]